MAAHDPAPVNGASTHDGTATIDQGLAAFDRAVASPSLRGRVLWSFARSVTWAFVGTAILGGALRAVITAIATVITLDPTPTPLTVLRTILSTGPSSDDFLNYLSIFATVAIAAGLSVLLTVDSGSRLSSHTRRWTFGRGALLFTGIAVWTVLPFHVSTYDGIARLIIGIGFILLLVCASELTDTPLLRVVQADARRAAERDRLLEFVRARVRSRERWACSAQWEPRRRRDVAAPALYIAGGGAVGIALAGILGGAAHRWEYIAFTITPAFLSWGSCYLLVISAEHRRLGRLLDDPMTRFLRSALILTAPIAGLTVAVAAMSVGPRLFGPILATLFLPVIITVFLLRDGSAIDASTRARVLEHLALLRHGVDSTDKAVGANCGEGRDVCTSGEDTGAAPLTASARERQPDLAPPRPWASLQVGPLEMTLHRPFQTSRTRRRAPRNRWRGI